MAEGGARRLGRDDWLTLGMGQLAAVGPDGLRLDALCAALGKTKGSFYHHFEDHDAYLAALLDAWAEVNAEAVVDAAGSGSDEMADLLREAAGDGDEDAAAALAELFGEAGAAGRTRLSRIAAAIDPFTETALRKLAAVNPLAAARVAEVDERRVDWLAAALEAETGCAPARAADLARIEYAAFVGAQTLWPDLAPEARARIGDLLDRLVTRGGAESA